MVSIKHKLTLYAEAVKERTIRVLINVSQIPRTLRNVLLGKCPLISSSKANSCHHRTKPTRYFPDSALYFSFSNKLTKMALLIILRYCTFKTNKVTNRVITLEICLKSLLYIFENLFNCDSSSQFSWGTGKGQWHLFQMVIPIRPPKLTFNHDSGTQLFLLQCFS